MGHREVAIDSNQYGGEPEDEPREGFEILYIGYLEAEVLCLACDGTIYIGCDYQPYESDTNAGEAFMCGTHADKVSTCTCNHSEQTLYSVASIVEDSMLDHTRNGDDY